ncbi:MAG TPA: benzoate-CoA ligase family protein [Candidatus Acidoferrales bacterium]|jgi:benzoate-CoA ligase|nr:benzoate-CoA ligase family protein [Candidatus Acidoferrales bacterium]
MREQSGAPKPESEQISGQVKISELSNIPAKFNIAEYFLDRPAAEHPNRIAIVGEPAGVSYGELASLANRFASALAREGIARGERVLIILPDSAEFIAAFFGAAKIGAVAVPVNPMTREADYAHYLRDSRARLVIVHEGALAAFLPAASGFPADAIVVLGSEAAGLKGMKRWSEWIGARDEKIAARPTLATDAAFFLYTSGSGGNPKAAVHLHKDMLVTSRGFAQGVMGISAADRTYSVSKLFFAYGLGNGMYFPLSAGASCVLDPDRPRPERAAEILVNHRPTIFFAVPTFYLALLGEVDRGLAADFSSVRLAVSAGERLPPEIFERFKMRFGLEILDGIGSTEMLHMFLSARRGHVRAGSCGEPVPGYEAKIVDDAGSPVADGEIGNLWVKGGSAFSGYWGIPELTARTKQGEWVVTGDKFYRDTEGYYHYCGRADDMMKVSGMWVAPTEVENALLGHAAVAEAAVVGVIDEAGLTRPLAFVVIHPDSAPTPALGEELREFVRGRLPGYKCPSEVKFLDALPKTATGKIQRFRLRGAP